MKAIREEPGSGGATPASNTVTERFAEQSRFRRWAPIGLLGVVFLLQWSLLMNILGPTWDAAFYYSYARSLVFDQDLSIVNDLQLSYPTASSDYVSRELHNNRTQTGEVYAPFAIGSALLWAPLLAAIRLGTMALGVAAETGFEWYYLAPAATLSALLGFIAICVAYFLAAREAGRGPALLAAVTLSFASPLIYYQFREPLYAHIPSALLNTLFIVVWWRRHRQIPSAWHGIASGALLALAALMRWQNAIYIILPLISATWSWLSLSPSEKRVRLPALILFLAALGGAFAAVFSPQLVVWQSHYGSWLTIPQGSEFMDWSRPYLGELLLSPFRGLLPWMPVFMLAFAGLLLKARRRPRLAIPLILLLLVSTYINASSRDWFAGGGYGPRRSAGELATFVLGFAWLLSLVRPGLRHLLGPMAGVLLALHQWLLLRFGLEEKIGGRVLSMAPNFEWAETTLSEFASQLVGHIPDILLRPVNVFIFPGSPLDRLLQDDYSPLRHVLALGVAGTFIVCGLLVLAAARRGQRTYQPRRLAKQK